MFEPWPAWASRWWGVLARILAGLAGSALGALLMFLGYFGATFKKYPHEWTVENVGLVVVGVMVALSALVMAIRPSRFTVASVAGVAIAAGLIGAVM